MCLEWWCPNCKKEVHFGYFIPTTDEEEKQIEKEEFLLGGCVIRDKNYCPKCKTTLKELKSVPKREREG